MASISNPSMDPIPLLGRRGAAGGLRGAARFLRRASMRRMREPTMMVRARAAEALDGGWIRCRPLLLLDVLWNMAFVMVAAVVLGLSLGESPAVPLRVWVVGYAVQCVMHVVCVSLEQRSGSSSLSSATGVEVGERDREDEESTSIAKHLASANTMSSFIWWIVGFYWVSAGGQTLTHDAPQLYWLCIVFLAFDVFFVLFCVLLACIVGVAVCCCLPCILAILYAVVEQEGASEDDIHQLPKYKFRRVGDPERSANEISGPCGGIMTECGSDPPIEHVVRLEDAECCICISSYDDGVELRELPCNHHFHLSCIEKWLHINATCPLCKYNIIKNSNYETVEV